MPSCPLAQRSRRSAGTPRPGTSGSFSGGFPPRRLLALLLLCLTAQADAGYCVPGVPQPPILRDLALAARIQPARRPSPRWPCSGIWAIEKRTGRDGRPYGIGFELRMPEKWEQRFLFQGGGGMDGMIRPALGSSSGADKTPGLARGFAVAATDAGHQGSGPNPMADASFGRDQQARIDNAYRSIERVTEVSKELVRQFYGQAWKHSYIAGCSNGGRQGLMAAQRFPERFRWHRLGRAGFPRHPRRYRQRLGDHPVFRASPRRTPKANPY